MAGERERERGMWDAGVEDGNGHYVTLQRTCSKDG